MKLFTMYDASKREKKEEKFLSFGIEESITIWDDTEENLLLGVLPYMQKT